MLSFLFSSRSVIDRLQWRRRRGEFHSLLSLSSEASVPYPSILGSAQPSVSRSPVPLFRRVRAPSLPPPPSSGTPCSAGRGPTHTPPTRWDTHLFPVERLVSSLESDHLVSLQGGKTQIIGPEEEEEEDDGYSINEVRESKLVNVLLYTSRCFSNWGSWVDEKEVKARNIVFFHALLKFEICFS